MLKKSFFKILKSAKKKKKKVEMQKPVMMRSGNGRGQKTDSQRAMLSEYKFEKSNKCDVFVSILIS